MLHRCMGKVVPVHAKKAYRGGEIYLDSFLAMTLE
jgi:hypothetical protein